MNTKLLIYGASDDLVEVHDLNTNQPLEEYDAYAKPVTLAITDPAGHCLEVAVEFDADGWGITLDCKESFEVPGWSVRHSVSPDNEDDPAVLVEAPEGTTVDEA